MRILFIHQNFPGQFKHLAPAMAAIPGNQVVALAINKNPSHPAVKVIHYKINRTPCKTTHPWVGDLETKVLRGEAVYLAAMSLRQQGFMPDIVVAHPGWGESLFIKDVWPETRLALYCEFFYLAQGGDVGFDPEFAESAVGDACRMRMKNANNLLHFPSVDTAISPTHWQKSTFPEPFRSKISVIHDGIDTERLLPHAEVSLTLNDRLQLTRQDEIITFVNRNLEPYRGYHTFMRALPALLARRPNARVLIVGGNEVSYGKAPPKGKTWRDIFLAEVRGHVDLSRIHFLGKVPYNHFISLLQISTVHVYLTYPFVLSWSLLEAMSVGCAIVASDTQPLREAIVHDETGRLFDFFSAEQLADEVVRLLESPDDRARLGQAARRFAQANYDLKSICLPRQIAWLNALQ
jgi:glycosyltransferase involved in cell wall biosynthesis